MIDAIVRFYKFQPVIANLILAGLVLALYQGIHMMGGPEIDFKWLIGILIPAQAVVTRQAVTPNPKVRSVNKDPQ